MKHALKLIPAALLAFSFGVHADVKITIQQVGPDVVVKGSGGLSTENVTCMPIEDQVGLNNDINDESADVFFGIQLQPILARFNVLKSTAEPEGGRLMCAYQITGRKGLGIGSSKGFIDGKSQGDPFGFEEQSLQDEREVIVVRLPVNYKSGSELDFSGIVAGKTFDQLGLVVGGNYEWTFSTEPIEAPSGEQPSEDDAPRRKAAGTEFLSITVLGAPAPTAATPVPTLGALGLMGLAGAIGAAGVALNRRRKQ